MEGRTTEMSVHAKTTMETMPNSCAECRLGRRYGFAGDVECRVLGEYFTGNVRPPHKERPDKCPLVLNSAQLDNPPLTIKQLKQMDNEPVWTDKRCGVVRADPQITRRPGMPAIHFNYGWEWADDLLACGSVYSHKPVKDGE